jgi:hypothetical protein
LTTREVCGRGDALSFGHRADGLSLIHRQGGEESLAASCSPSRLAPEQICDGHSFDFPAMAQDGFGRCQFAGGDATLDLSTGPSHSVGALKCTQILSAVNRAGRVVHGVFHALAWSAMQVVDVDVAEGAAAGAELQVGAKARSRPVAPNRIPGEVNRNSVKPEVTVRGPAWSDPEAKSCGSRDPFVLAALVSPEDVRTLGPQQLWTSALCTARSPKRTQKRAAHGGA